MSDLSRISGLFAPAAVPDEPAITAEEAAAAVNGMINESFQRKQQKSLSLARRLGLAREADK